MASHKMFHEVEGLIHRVARGQMSRRHLFRRAAALGVSASVVEMMLATNDGGMLARSRPARAQEAVPAPDQTLVYVEASAPRSLDPHIAFEQQSLHSVRAGYEMLVKHTTGTTEIEPMLATEWDVSDDATVYTFTLREGVVFQDGTPFDSEAVKFSYDRLKSLNTGLATLLANLAEVNVVDPMTVEFVLAQPHVYYMTYFAKVPIVSPAAVTANEVDGDHATAWFEAGNTAGTGPYRITEFRRNEIMIMDRFEGYWRGWDGTHISRIAFPIVPESTTRRQMLESGEGHFIGRIPIDDIEAMRGLPGIRVEVFDTFEVDIMPMMLLKPPFDNVLVRQAMQYAFDYQGFLDGVLLGYGALPSGQIAPGYVGFNSDMPVFTQDLDRTAQLLQEAGVTEATIDMNYVETVASERQAAIIFQDALAPLGITVNVQAMPWSTMVEIASNPDSAMHMSNLLMATFTADPVYTLTTCYGCEVAGKPNNWAYYCNPELETLLREAAATFDEEESLAKLYEAQNLVVADAPAIFYANPKAVEAYSDQVQGYVWDPVDYYWQVDWYSIWLSE